ncbi:hypothetical protein PFISCL1PPCAC_3158, partial [Pristionchus fissidentatus]
ISQTVLTDSLNVQCEENLISSCINMQMKESVKNEIIDILQAAGEPVVKSDEMVCATLGEGRGMVSCLSSVNINGRSYAIKVSDASSRPNWKLYTQQHNRELQVHQFFEKFRNGELISSTDENLVRTVRFFGGSQCDRKKPGLLIMEDLTAESTIPDKPSEGLPLATILSVISGVAANQSAYLSVEEELELIPKDLLFEPLCKWVNEDLEKASKHEWFRAEWKEPLNVWADPDNQRDCQYAREEGDLPLALGHADMWMTNILFEKKETSEALQLLAFIDWQCAIVGNALLDVASVVAFNMNATERRKHEHEILQHYVDEVKKRSGGFRKEFPIDTVDKLLPQYRRSLRFAALQMLLRVAPEAKDKANAMESARAETGKIDIGENERLGVYTQRFIGLLEDIVD